MLGKRQKTFLDMTIEVKVKITRLRVETMTFLLFHSVLNIRVCVFVFTVFYLYSLLLLSLFQPLLFLCRLRIVLPIFVPLENNSQFFFSHNLALILHIHARSTLLFNALVIEQMASILLQISSVFKRCLLV